MRPGTTPHRGRRASLARGASAWAVAAGVVLAAAGCGEDVLVGECAVNKNQAPIGGARDPFAVGGQPQDVEV